MANSAMNIIRNDACPLCGFWRCRCLGFSPAALVPTDSDPDMDEALRRVRGGKAVLVPVAANCPMCSEYAESGSACPRCGAPIAHQRPALAGAR